LFTGSEEEESKTMLLMPVRLNNWKKTYLNGNQQTWDDFF
jgi:hypothetical protein